ncbi:MAG: DUF2442 domain-containing protein [bacterium]
MSTSRNRIVKEPLAVGVEFTESSIRLLLADGREISAPLEWFPRLRDASPHERNNWRLIGNGVGVHWEELDEDISVAGLLD